MTGKEIIDSVSSKVERLISEHAKAVSQRDALSRENASLRNENRTLLERVKSLESDLALAQLNAGLSGSASNRIKARRRVSSMLREVSQCISLVENMRRAESDRDKAADTNAE